jgi:ABC-type branched-subunit amino acid transport system ATPase component
VTILQLTDVEVGARPQPTIAVGELSVAAGEAVAIVGPAGAGKSLLLRGLAGFVPVTGTMLLDGAALERRPAYLRSRAGLALVGQDGFTAGDLTVAECLRLATRGRRRRSRRWSRRALFAALPGLDRVQDEEIGSLGPWERLAAGLAYALRTGPRVVLLDEPGASLSDQSLDRLRASLGRFTAAGLGVVFATRYEPLAAWMTDRGYEAVGGAVVPLGPIVAGPSANASRTAAGPPGAAGPTGAGR